MKTPNRSHHPCDKQNDYHGLDHKKLLLHFPVPQKPIDTLIAKNSHSSPFKQSINIYIILNI